MENESEYIESAISSERKGCVVSINFENNSESSSLFSGNRVLEKHVLSRDIGRLGTRAQAASKNVHSRVDKFGRAPESMGDDVDVDVWTVSGTE